MRINPPPPPPSDLFSQLVSRRDFTRGMFITRIFRGGKEGKVNVKKGGGAKVNGEWFEALFIIVIYNGSRIIDARHRKLEEST